MFKYALAIREQDDMYKVIDTFNEKEINQKYMNFYKSYYAIAYNIPIDDLIIVSGGEEDDV